MRIDALDRDVRGGMRLVTFAFFALLLAMLIAVVALFLLAPKAHADDMDAVLGERRQEFYIHLAALKAYELENGLYRECSEHAKMVLDYLASYDVQASYRVCTRKGEGHTYVVANPGLRTTGVTGEWVAIDNSSPYPMSVAEVGCD